MLGILLIDKPGGITSHDVIHRMRRVFDTRRIGHAGTLDPLATGLLVIAVGPATRFLQYLPMEPKVYEAELTFGARTTTQDSEGDTLESRPVPDDLDSALREALPSFTGLQKQTPPMYSAVKVGGRPLYKLARKGEEVERTERTIHVESIDVLDVEPPRARLRIVCSGGTYVRTLADSLGQALGSAAHLSALRRTACGKFALAEAVEPDSASPERLIPLGDALAPMPAMDLTPDEELALRHGKRLAVSPTPETQLVALRGPSGGVFGVARVLGNELQPECVLPMEVEHRTA